jgi:hypothetical protein
MFPCGPPALQSELALQPHREFVHTIPYCCWVQSLPQPPQLCRSAVTLVSQPSSAPVVGCEQFALPAAQVEEHLFCVQERLATLVDEQVRAQPPQLNTSFTVACSHPSPG